MAEIWFGADAEPPPLPKSRRGRKMEFLELKAAADNAGGASSSGPKRRSVQPFPRRCGNEDDENRGQRNNDEVEVKYGVTSICGRRREMDDTVSVHLYFATKKNEPQIPLHFFGVFDGHGCSHVSQSCKNGMHEIVKEEIDEREIEETEEWKKMIRRSFERMDEEVMKQREKACSSKANNISCRCELQTPNRYDTVRSTALIALLMPHKFIIANCGDSRAVLSRKTTGILPVSSDHKRDRADELSRIESRGGRVICSEGARVSGVLATSRAMGDGGLKPYVISEPEVVIMDRTAEDEFMILATDGLWDVVTNETACDAVRACMRAHRPLSSLSESSGSMSGGSDKTCSDAAILLTRLAMAKHSSDNITIVVIDLRTTSSPQLKHRN